MAKKNLLKALHIKLITVLLCSLFSIQSAFASHAAGGELIYEWIGGNTYVFTFKFYRDCTGVSEPGIAQLCINNTCNFNQYTVSLPKIATLPDGRVNGSQVASGCPSFKNTCDSAGSSLPAYREWWYQDTVTLQGKCDNWRFGVSVSARNPSQNITGGFLYVEATLNNLNVLYNNSTVFNTKPVPYVCVNMPFTYNNGAVDKDKDVLVFEPIIPLNNSSCAGAHTPVSFQTLTPPLGLPNNPFQTNNTYVLNAATGNISYTASQQGAQTTTMRVKEYRNGILVGSVIRDIQVQVLPCNSTPVALDIDTLSLVNSSLDSGTVLGCVNVPLSFCFDVKATDTSTLLAISDNKQVTFSTATISYQNNATDSVRGCFTWTPTSADSGLKVLTIIAKDSTCRAPGVAVTQVFTIPVMIETNAPNPKVITPVDLCYNVIPDSLVANGKNLLWYNSATGGVGIPGPIIPDVSKLGDTSYFVSQTPSGCESPRTRVDITVHDFPTIDLVSLEDSVCAFNLLKIKNKDTSSIITFFSWNVDTGRIAGTPTDSTVEAWWTSSGIKTIYLTLYNHLCSVSDSLDIYVKNGPNAYFHITHDVCLGAPVDIIPTDYNGTYTWTLDGQTINDTAYKPKYVLNWPTIGTKKAQLHIKGYNGCEHTYLDSVTVHSFPLAKISIDDHKLCAGKQFSLHAQQGQRYEYSWSPPQMFDQNTQPDVTGTVERSGYLHLKVRNQWECESADSIFVNGGACCDIFVPDAFTPNGDGTNDFLRLVDIQKHQLVQFVIAHRRGNIILNTKDPNAKWDGTFNGEPQDIGTYAYYIKYICNTGEPMEKKGTFHLVR